MARIESQEDGRELSPKRCPICGEWFTPRSADWVYKRSRRGKELWFCRYNHMREYDHMLEVERQKALEDQRAEGGMNNYARVWKQTPGGCRKRARECREALAQKQAEYDATLDKRRRKVLAGLITIWKDKIREAEERYAELTREEDNDLP